uniref:Fignl1 interacting regulator of recombination and mitosis n=1 Tax=Hippocampus comes TaxID=109280 RepID=A0A3Q2YE23_HIPCM
MTCCFSAVIFFNCSHTLHHKSEGWDDHIRKFHFVIIFFSSIILVDQFYHCGFFFLPPTSLLGVLKIITDLFLPHIALLDLENECFSKILPKAVTMFDSIMKELSIQVGSSSSQNTEVCSSLRNILMVDYLKLEFSVSVITCSLKKSNNNLSVLRDTFQHCKESEAVYCGHLSVVADLLQSLFKEACALHKALLELLDGLSLDSSSSEEVASDIVVGCTS